MSLATTLFRITPPTFRAGSCHAPLQPFANELMAGSQITMLVNTGTAFYNLGNVTPLPENRIYPWIHTDNGLLWLFKYGLWTSPRPTVEQNGMFRWMWNPGTGGAESLLWALDGGDGTDPVTNPPTVTTGSMWQVDIDDTSMAGRFPVGVGSTANGTVIPINGTGGADEHTLALTELPDVNLSLEVQGGQATGLDADNTEVLTNPSGALNDVTLQVPLGGSGEAFDILPPYRGVYFVKPTGRIYRTLPA